MLDELYRKEVKYGKDEEEVVFSGNRQKGNNS